MAKAKRQYDMVKVTWVDAEEVGETGWNNLKAQLRSASKPCPTMQSVGFLVYQDEHHISLISSLGPDICGTVEKIPMGFVTRIDKLTVTPPKPS
jgi:hypothetical protein